MAVIEGTANLTIESNSTAVKGKILFGASAYDDPEVYRNASPISTIKVATTPTLIYVGERDDIDRVAFPTVRLVEDPYTLVTIAASSMLRSCATIAFTTGYSGDAS